MEIIYDDNVYDFNDSITQSIYQRSPKSIYQPEYLFHYRPLVDCRQFINSKQETQIIDIYKGKDKQKDEETVDFQITIIGTHISDYTRSLYVQKLDDVFGDMFVVKYFWRVFLKTYNYFYTF